LGFPYLERFILCPRDCRANNSHLGEQEQQRVAVGPGNAHVISILQVSSDAATLRRGSCGHAVQWFTRPRIYAAAAVAAATAAAAADAAVYRQFDD